MKTIFVKYNRSRLAKFQILTKVVVDQQGKRWVIKEAIGPEAIPHIKNMMHNYELLIQTYPWVHLAKPVLVAANSIEFEMIEADSFESLLLCALDKQDTEQFFHLIASYVNYLDRFVEQRSVDFHPCEQFEEVFGAWEIQQSQDTIKICNIDLIFSNVFFSVEEMVQIDYEWIFPYSVPKSFILWRALNAFFKYQGQKYTFLKFEEVCKRFGYSDADHLHFMKMELCFQKYVNGDVNKILVPLLKPRYHGLGSIGSKSLFHIIRARAMYLVKKIKNRFT